MKKVILLLIVVLTVCTSFKKNESGAYVSSNKLQTNAVKTDLKAFTDFTTISWAGDEMDADSYTASESGGITSLYAEANFYDLRQLQFPNKFNISCSFDQSGNGTVSSSQLVMQGPGPGPDTGWGYYVIESYCQNWTGIIVAEISRVQNGTLYRFSAVITTQYSLMGTPYCSIDLERIYF